MKWFSILALACLLGGCTKRADLPVGAAAYANVPPPGASLSLREYLIQPPDRLTVSVYREPDLSISDVEVDSAGKIAMPLLGSVVAAGKTTEALAADISAKLGARFLVHPEVTAYVSTAASQRVVVEGSVTQPGVYTLVGPTTLLGALALARGPTRVAALKEVAVFRQIDGQRVAAKFDIPAIRRGEAPDPEIIANDTVVVGFSGLKSAYRDVIQLSPIFSVFRPLYD